MFFNKLLTLNISYLKTDQQIQFHWIGKVKFKWLSYSLQKTIVQFYLFVIFIQTWTSDLTSFSIYANIESLSFSYTAKIERQIQWLLSSEYRTSTYVFLHLRSHRISTLTSYLLGPPRILNVKCNVFLNVHKNQTQTSMSYWLFTKIKKIQSVFHVNRTDFMHHIDT